MPWRVVWWNLLVQGIAKEIKISGKSQSNRTNKGIVNLLFYGRHLELWHVFTFRSSCQGIPGLLVPALSFTCWCAVGKSPRALGRKIPKEIVWRAQHCMDSLVPELSSIDQRFQLIPLQIPKEIPVRSFSFTFLFSKERLKPSWATRQKFYSFKSYKLLFVNHRCQQNFHLCLTGSYEWRK